MEIKEWILYKGMKINFQLRLDNIISGINASEARPRLLLHSCCGPCSSYVLDYLLNFFDITVFFYNPSIQPKAEYLKRLETQRELINKMCGKNCVPLIAPDWDDSAYEQKISGLEHEPEGGMRCNVCFRLRLSETARTAANRDFDFFCTTLTVSPHKNAGLINKIGEDLSASLSVKWLPSDFKKRGGYKRSVELSREYGLYRQDYCGCFYSIR